MYFCASNRIPDLCPCAGTPAFSRFSAREAPSKTGRAKNPFSLLGNFVIYGNKKRTIQGFPGDSLTTGSPNEVARQATMGVARGLKINEYGVFRGAECIAGRAERRVFTAVRLPYIEPELREGAGEIEAAKVGRLPLVSGTKLPTPAHL
jgi:hypothetical protein